MAEQHDRLERVGRLLGCLLDREGPVSRAEIEELFPFYRGERGRRRFEEDKAALRRVGIPLRTQGDRYEVRREDYELPPLELTEAERVALSLAARSVDLSEVVWGRLAGTKVGAVDGSPVPTVAQLPGLDPLPLLEEASKRRSRCAIDYRGTPRTIDPYKVLFRHGRWYVVAHDDRRDRVIPFRVDRIWSIEVLEDETFEIPAELDPASVVPDDPLLMGEDTTTDAVVRMHASLASILERRPVDAEDGEVRVRVRVSHFPAFVQWVLGFGELAVVEEPPEPRDAVVARLRELAG